MEWREKPSEEGGITWLELYVWYTMHGGKLVGIDEEGDKLRNRNTLHNEITVFKKVVRRMSLQCTPDDDEWHFETSYARANRLKPFAIQNKHPGIKGMPRMEEQEAERIAKAILALKGITKKKHMEALQRNELELIPKPLRYRGSAAWKTLAGKFEDWTKDEEHIEPYLPISLRTIYCPKCSAGFDVVDKRLKYKAVFSNLKCKGCNETINAKMWTC